MPYALAGHVFVCREGEHVVFLDVRKDRYFALEAAQTSGLGQVVPGWPVAGAQGGPSHESAPHVEGPTHSAVLALLLERGLLCEHPAVGKDATPATPVAPGGELTADSLDGSSRLNAKVVGQFIASAATASFVLKYHRLERVLRRVARRNGASSPGRRSPWPGAERALELVAAFASLRPFFFTSKDACLFEALALSEFLARHEIFPRWVFGVQARPFAAHCWLQQGDLVLNDTVEHVSL
ncbi:MAG: lasso peptide biosynthesis B2 protein, partial [Gammaproteobacteria bacterium]